MSEQLITIRVSVFNAGCLPHVLEREIGRVEQVKRAFGGNQTPSEERMMAAYLGQLRACLAAVEEARRA